MSSAILTQDCLTNVFFYLKDNDIKTTSLVSKLWYAASTPVCLWEHYYRSECPNFNKPSDLNWKQFYQLNKPGTRIKKFQILKNSVICAWGKVISVWNERYVNNDIQYALLQKESTHSGSIEQFVAHIEGRVAFIVTAASDKTIKKWRWTGKDIQECGTISHLRHKITALALNEKFIIAGDQDGSVSIWRHNSHSNRIDCIENSSLHKGRVTCLQLDSTYNSSFIFSGGKDGVINIHKKINESFYKIQTLRAHQGGVSAIAYNNKYHFLLSCGATDKAIKIWKKKNDKFDLCALIPDAHDGEITDLCASKMQECIISSSNDGKIKFWTTRQNMRENPDLWENGIESNSMGSVACVRVNPTNPKFRDMQKVYRLTNDTLEVAFSPFRLGQSTILDSKYKIDLKET